MRTPATILGATEMRERLAAFLTQQVGSPVDVRELRRIPGGSSLETWAFDAVITDGTRCESKRLVLRRDPGTRSMQTNRRDEFLLLQAARDANVPVPNALWLGDDPSTLGGRFFVMEWIDGETLGGRLIRDDRYAEARAKMISQLGEILGRIHDIDFTSDRLAFLLQLPSNESPAQAEVDRYEQIYRFVSSEPHPAFEIAFRWLRQNLPNSNRRTIVHGDFRIGNIMFGPEGVRSVLDWELAHIGDPMEDLGWLCIRSWRFGGTKPVGGIGERHQLFAAYESGSGIRVDAAHVHFWEVFGNLKWGIICIAQARTFLDGHSQSVELASLGRRTAEVELELLDLIEGR